MRAFSADRGGRKTPVAEPVGARWRRWTLLAWALGAVGPLAADPGLFLRVEGWPDPALEGRLLQDAFLEVRNDSRPGPGGSVPATFSDLTIIRSADADTPRLLGALWRGDPLERVFLEYRRAAPDGSNRALLLELEDVLLTGYSLATDGESPAESWSLTYAQVRLSYYQQGGDGLIEGEIYSTYDLALQKSTSGERNLMGAQPPSVEAPIRVNLVANQPYDLEFSLLDPDTPAESLQVAVTHPSPALLARPVAVSGSGAVRSARLVPQPEATGRTALTITVRDELFERSRSVEAVVDAANEPPVLALAAEGAPNLVRGVPVALPALLLGDPDLTAGSLQLSLACEFGWFSVETNRPGGVTAEQVEGNHSALVVILAPLAQLQATFGTPGGATYTVYDDPGEVTWLLTLEDLGPSGAGGGLSASLAIPVHVFPTLYAEWISRYFEPEEWDDPARTAEFADPEGDGWTNFLEYALGGHPLHVETGDRRPTLQLDREEGTLYLTISFTRRHDDPLLFIYPEFRTPEGWVSGAEEFLWLHSETLGPDYESVRWQILRPVPDGPSSLLVRLRAVQLESF